MTPTPFENVVPMKDAEAKRANLKLYNSAMKAVAEKRKLEFVDLFDGELRRRSYPTTENGIHLPKHGYRVTAVPTFSGPDSWDHWESNSSSDSALLKAIVAKNELFFHRWRPQNLTYLTGFRKHEQGNNAKEIVQFDPLVEKAEKEIAELRKKVK